MIVCDVNVLRRLSLARLLSAAKICNRWRETARKKSEGRKKSKNVISMLADLLMGKIVPSSHFC